MWFFVDGCSQGRKLRTYSKNMSIEAAKSDVQCSRFSVYWVREEDIGDIKKHGMDKKLVAIFLLMKELRKKWSLVSFQDRLFMQKAIYLTQVLAIDLRFRFGWYLRGPYSKDLTDCLYELDADEKLRATIDALTLRDEFATKMQQLKDLVESNPTDLDEAVWLELVSSIHYLKHISCPNENITETNAKEKLISAGKKNFDSASISAAWHALDKMGLISSKVVRELQD